MYTADVRTCHCFDKQQPESNFFLSLRKTRFVGF